MRVNVDHPVLGAMTQIGVPFKLSATPASIRSAPPMLGEHTDAIVTELGYSDSDISALRSRGVI